MRTLIQQILFVLTFTSVIIISKHSDAQIITPDSATINKITEQFGEFANKTFSNKVRTVRFTNPKWNLAQPVMKLNSGHKLELSFDLLEDESKPLYYTIEHINNEWKFRDASPMEFINGFEQNEIEEYEHSYTSTTPFFHYSLQIPNDDIKLKVSGNYIVRVFEEDKEKPMLIRRFIVYEQKTRISGDVQRDMRKNYGGTHQKVNFSVFLNQITVNDPYRDLEIKILPNNNFYKRHEGYKPLFVKGDELIYEDKPLNTFEGGNEYRTIILKDMSYQPIMVEQIFKMGEFFHVKLNPDESRRYKKYEQHEDLNGNFYIEAENSLTPDLDADYVYVYFKLNVEIPYLSGQVFVYGGITGKEFSLQNAMSYDAQLKQYQLRLPVKQGFYDYQYVVLDGYENYKPNFTTIEGTQSQTQNEYFVYVYYKDLSLGMDRVVGFEILRNN